jgi:hypothetical protein
MAHFESPVRVGLANLPQSVDALNETLGVTIAPQALFYAVPVASSTTAITTLQTVTNGSWTLQAVSGQSVSATVLGVPMIYLGINTSNAITQLISPSVSNGGGYARGICVSGTSSTTSALLINVVGVDYWGRPQTERISTTGGVVVTYGKKAFLAVSSITTTGNTTSAMSIGTSDVIGFPYRVDYWGQLAQIVYSDSNITTSAGFTSATAGTQSSTTGDPKGTFLLPSAATGTKSLFAYITVMNPNNTFGTFGVTPA